MVLRSGTRKFPKNSNSARIVQALSVFLFLIFFSEYNFYSFSVNHSFSHTWYMQRGIFYQFKNELVYKIIRV